MGGVLTWSLSVQLFDRSNNPSPPQDPVAFVNRLLEEKDKYDRIVQRAFTNDKQARERGMKSNAPLR